jgi:drug/metabolite transporter (DMT)-like permease
MLLSTGSDQLIPELACVMTALTYAIAGIYGRRFKDLPALTVSTGQITASTILLLPSLLIDRPWTLPNPSAHAWLAMIALAVFSTALAYIIYFRILASAGATNVMLVTFLVPVSAILLGVAFLDESFTTRALMGMLLIGVGLAAIDGRLSSCLRGYMKKR